MTTTTKRLLTRAMTAVLVWSGCVHEAAAQPERAQGAERSQTAIDPRVRTTDQLLVDLIGQAAEVSPTFRNLVNAIGATDGVVWVERTGCGRGVRACMAHTVAQAGPYRLLRVNIDPRKTDLETVVALAHELRHTLEVLAEPGITTPWGIHFLYERVGSRRGTHYETDAAVAAEDAVHHELRVARWRGTVQRFFDDNATSVPSGDAIPR